MKPFSHGFPRLFVVDRKCMKYRLVRLDYLRSVSNNFLCKTNLCFNDFEPPQVNLFLIDETADNT